MTAVASGSVGQALDLLASGVDALLSGDLSALTGVEVVAVLDRLETQRRRLDTVDARLLAEVGERGIAGELGRTSTVDLLIHRLRVESRVAKVRVRAAQELGPRRSVIGEPLAPQLPVTAAAVADGSVSAAHASVIGRVLDRIPPNEPAETTTIAETFLVDAARHSDPAALRRTGELLLARLNPDGPPPDDGRRCRTFDLADSADNGVGGVGGVPGRFRFTTECAALWRVIMDALAAPRPVTATADGTEQRDERSAGQRRHDAMLEVARRVLRSGDLPDCGGVPATLIISADVDDLARTNGTVRTAHGDLIPADQILSLAGELDVEVTLTDEPSTTGPAPDLTPLGSSWDARLRPTIDRALTGRCATSAAQHDGCDAAEPHSPPRRVRRRGAGIVLAHGRTHRIVTAGQRRALAGRDGPGCSFPGCTRPLAWTQAHHIVRWEHGGPTDLDNLTLVCTFHHRLLDDGDWQVIMADDGRPAWIPPAWLDPLRRPLRNTEHHPQGIDFGVVLTRLRPRDSG